MSDEHTGLNVPMRRCLLPLGLRVVAIAVAVFAMGVISVGSRDITLSHIDPAFLPDLTLRQPDPALRPEVPRDAAMTTAHRFGGGAAREVLLAVATVNGESCFCWVIDVTPPDLYVPDTFGRPHTPLGTRAYWLVLVDARTGAMWWNQFAG